MEGDVLVFEFLKGVATSLIASIVFYYFFEIRKHMSKSNQMNHYQLISPAYVKAVKKQFYICFFSIVFIIAIYIFPEISDFSFLNVFIAVVTFFLLVLALFAFICIEEVVNVLLKQEKDKDSNDKSDKI